MGQLQVRPTFNPVVYSYGLWCMWLDVDLGNANNVDRPVHSEEIIDDTSDSSGNEEQSAESSLMNQIVTK